MFTGIVSARGRVTGIDAAGERLTMTITAPYDDLEPGESIAVNGACLTVVACGSGWFTVEAVVTTRGRTRFAQLEEGEEVNLERAMTLGDRMGGHLVQGHVDGIGTAEAVRDEADAVLVDIRVPPEVAELCVPLGSITVDGVSLTVNAMPAAQVVQVAIIPYTREHTTLGGLVPGDQVHLEADIIGKYVRQLFDARTGRS